MRQYLPTNGFGLVETSGLIILNVVVIVMVTGNWSVKALTPGSEADGLG